MRKNIFLIVLFILFFPAVSFAQPVIDFDLEIYAAGATTQGDVVEHTFKFTNKGNEDLLIEKVTSS
jgi:uncharacterized protein (DUF58 family)